MHCMASILNIIIINLKRYLLDSTTNSDWLSWEQYAACQLTCVSGYETQTQSCCTTGNNFKCLTLPWDTLKSLVGTCPVDGQWDHWSDFSRCSVTCGQGTHTRTRVCMFDPNSPHGNDCVGSATETGSCQAGVCPVDGVWTIWTDWTSCPVTCGVGHQNRSRTCGFPANLPRGQDCVGDSQQIHECNTNPCPVNGVWKSWTSWTACTVTCGTGHSSRTRLCQFDPHSPHGSYCMGLAQYSCSCNTQPCLGDGVWSEWSTWSSCSVSCGSGHMTRTRTCQFPANEPHGAFCVGLNRSTTACTENKCHVDGVLSIWSNWTPCTVTCGGGLQNRTRTFNFPVTGASPGHDCVGDLFQTQDCNFEMCPVDGHWTLWSDWSGCSQTCGNGTQERTRTCRFDHSAPHGQSCPGRFKLSRTCAFDPCPRRCFVCTGNSGVEGRCNYAYSTQECGADENFCINDVTNWQSGTKHIIRRCGTFEDCKSGWLDVYSNTSVCVGFHKNYIYLSRFKCSFCCQGDNCNEEFNPTNKYYLPYICPF